MIEVTLVGGDRCRRMGRFREVVQQAARETTVPVHIIEAVDFLDPMRYGALALPALLIDGELAASGNAPSVETVRQLLDARAAQLSWKAWKARRA